nr:olfactory receptor 2T11 isoform X1 [Microcebus murinus]XP_012609980.1 olfactory receptor 2T11 isoform X1 [Microcebus murinus]
MNGSGGDENPFLNCGLLLLPSYISAPGRPDPELTCGLSHSTQENLSPASALGCVISTADLSHLECVILVFVSSCSLELAEAVLMQNTTSSSDFILLGLRVNSEATGIVFTVIFAIFVVAVTANLVMIFLIQVDSRLHTPMYFLLSQLSIMDTLFICTTVPKLLVDMVSKEKTISFVACGIQIFLYLTMIGSEFFLLGLMAYDRYVAVCNPLRYPVLMNRKVCLLLAAGAWFGGSLDGFLLTPITMNVPYCGSRSINHFFCEIPAVLKLACADTSLYEALMYICCVLMLLIPIAIISASYSLILLTVHRMRSAEGRKKAFTTCSSHLTVVSIFYGAAFYTYVLPQSFHTPEQDKVVSAFYTIVTPMLNPLIYSLRNKDVTGAFKKIFACCSSAQKAATSDA